MPCIDWLPSLQGMWVTNDYLPVMGLKAVVGRGFEESDFGQGPVKVVLLGYEFWQRAFNGDRQIIGKTVRISRWDRSEEHTSELQSHSDLVCRLLREKKKKQTTRT